MTTGADPASDRELANQIQENLDRQLPGNQLSVEVKDGIVTVVGEVASKAELQQVQSLVSATTGVQSVDIQVDVAAPASSARFLTLQLFQHQTGGFLMPNHWWQELWSTLRETIHLRRTRQRQAHTWLQRYRRKHEQSSARRDRRDPDR